MPTPLCVGWCNNSLDAGNVLAVIVGGAIGAICNDDSVVIGDGDSISLGGDNNLNVDAMRVGGDDSILGVGDLGTNDQYSSGSSGALVARKAGDILRVDDGIVLAAGGGILGMHSYGGPYHVAIHNLPAPRAFTIAAPPPPPLYTHKEWSFALLACCR
jgi:hypothetical protein